MRAGTHLFRNLFAETRDQRRTLSDDVGQAASTMGRTTSAKPELGSKHPRARQSTSRVNPAYVASVLPCYSTLHELGQALIAQ
jgi:hypothetical protein